MPCRRRRRTSACRRSSVRALPGSGRCSPSPSSAKPSRPHRGRAKRTPSRAPPSARRRRRPLHGRPGSTPNRPRRAAGRRVCAQSHASCQNSCYRSDRVSRRVGRSPRAVQISRPFALAGVPLAFAAGAVASRVLLRAEPQRWTADLSQPLVVVTAWRDYGLDFFVIFALTIALAASALIAAFSWPIVFSSDVYAYAAYGDLTLHGHNPYIPVSAAYHDRFVDAARWQWGG